ncbi:MAG: hypothetical protein H0V66_16050 [Bdellovibrionales bacterium]|nr:hypothetical protein [Bdellovibrionales bacterium]
MDKETLQIKELTFEVSYPSLENENADEKLLPVLEIENNTSAILVKVELEQAIELRNLLNHFIEASHE